MQAGALNLKPGAKLICSAMLAFDSSCSCTNLQPILHPQAGRALLPFDMQGFINRAAAMLTYAVMSLRDGRTGGGGGGGGSLVS